MTARRAKNRRTKGLMLALLLAMAPAVVVFAAQVGQAASIQPFTLNQAKSGLVTKDPLTTGDASLWTFGGSATVYGAPYQYYEDSAGLHIGVQSNTAGQWAGYYAAKGENAELFNAVLSLPSSTIAAAQNFNTGLYVQTGGPDVNYVTCAGGVNNQGYYWGVVQATGDTNGATRFTNLWFQWMGGQPLTRDCTIVTNGSNLLKVYLDGQLVFSSDTMNLGYQYPLTAFLEVQTTDSSTMHFSVYSDYYATASDTLTVTGVPPNATVEVASPTGSVLATGQADASGTATLKIGMYHMPLQAEIRVFVLGVRVGSTSSVVSLYGGDVYQASLAPGGASIGSVSVPYTSDPSTAPVISSAVGNGITLQADGPSVDPSGGSLCVFRVCL
jgi:hypothetical protein